MAPALLDAVTLPAAVYNYGGARRPVPKGSYGANLSDVLTCVQFARSQNLVIDRLTSYGIVS